MSAVPTMFRMGVNADKRFGGVLGFIRNNG